MKNDESRLARLRKRFLHWAQNVSRASWLAMTVLLVTITSLLITSLVGLTQGQDLADGLLDGRFESQLFLKTDELERYLDRTQREVRVLAASPMAADAARQFSDAYDELDAGSPDSSDTEAVVGYYRDVFIPALEATTGLTVGVRQVAPVGRAANYLQRHYIVEVPENRDPRNVDDAEDGSAWSEVHAEFHRGFADTANRLTLEDIYLVRPQDGVIIYSTGKDPDFATSLDIGPYSGSTLASITRNVTADPRDGEIEVIDLAPYLADLGQPVSFLAAPVRDAGQLLAILVAKYSTAPIDGIMTSDRAWEEEGFGTTGETFVVGADGRMRSISRAFVENPTAYIEDVTAAGTALESERMLMTNLDTTVMFQEALDGGDVEDILTSSTGIRDEISYTGEEVFAAYEVLDVEGLDWIVAAQQSRSEVEQPIADFRSNLIIAVAVFVVAISFATVAWASRVFQPVRAVSERLRKLYEEGESGVPVGEAPKRTQAEFALLAKSVNHMVESLGERRAQVASAAEERLTTIRSLLPPAVAKRIESGDRRVLDQLPQATVVVLAIDGLGAVVRERSAAESRKLVDQLVDELDSLAHHHGLDRVKLLGDAYFAGCGLTQPYLDHAPRSVFFALDAQDLVRELGERAGQSFALAAGIHSGPVTVGLSGSDLLAYDVWGQTVSSAFVEARAARRAEILVSEQTKAMLPPDIEVAEAPNSNGGQPTWRVVGYRVSEEASP